MSAVATVEAPSNVIPMTEATNLMEVISRAASDPNTDVGKLERLMSLYERIQDKTAEQAFGVAMLAAQDEMAPVRTDANNPQTKSRYATYGALDRAIRPIYAKHGFALSFDTGDGGPADHVRVLCYASHKAGHTRTYHIDMPADGKGARGGDVMTKTHASGSALSYGQRYLLKAIFNIVVSDDDDGNSAGGVGPITADQMKNIMGLIERFNVDIERFCKYYGVEAVKDIPAAQYRRVVESLNVKGRAK